ncbi:MAG: UDP-N-acetylmuramate--L-alanine ligase [Desulfobacteraceae bacterium]
MIGICGTGMASLAGLLKGQGFKVTGSDQNVYPPMSDLLRTLGIPVMVGYSAANLDPAPDLVVVGNVITGDNPEAVALARSGTPYLSFPQALRTFAIRNRRSLVVAGTHGKTTTSALAAWILETAGREPGFLIGGVPRNLPAGFSDGRGDCFVVEGDEYDSAFFDKGPKFLHYAPWAAVVTSIEFDHADIYRDLEHLTKSFKSLLALIPPEGLVVANADDPRAIVEARRASYRLVTYGLEAPADWSARDIRTDEDRTELTVLPPEGDPIDITTPLFGRHNLGNLLAAAALCAGVGVDSETLRRAALSFKGVKRRQEVKGEAGGVMVMDDFAHHPSAVRETIGAVRDKYPRRRLVAVFEPRSNSSRRKVFQGDYSRAFDRADLVFIAEPPLMEKIPPEERFSSTALTADLAARGIAAVYGGNGEPLLKKILGSLTSGDLVLIMSNGSFDNLTGRLIARLESGYRTEDG